MTIAIRTGSAHPSPGSSVTTAWGARPAAGEQACGDVCRVRFLHERWLVIIVADGLGHGRLAAEAAECAADFLLARFEQQAEGRLEPALLACHGHLRPTRGAAVLIARLDLLDNRFALCGIGHVEVMVRPRRAGIGVSLPGAVGCQMGSVKAFTSRLEENDLGAVWTDGIRPSFRLGTLTDRPLEDIVHHALEDHGNPRDDALAVVFRIGPGHEPCARQGA